jgi:hypothetical protein
LIEILAPLPWIDKISNHAQVGGIETSVIDNGAGRGTRIAWINTGTGLRYKVVLDRAMDIADAFYNQHSIAWLSHLGITSPQPFSHQGIDWLRTFGGGLLVTCGLSHIGGPEEDSFGERGLHGLISNSPAEIESIIQPDPAIGKLDFSITGKIKETKIFGPSLELRRTISGTLGKSSIHIHDEIVNRANTPAPHMLLYHFNFGWPLVDEGAELIWKGELYPRMSDSKIFREGYDFKKCPAPLEQHSGSVEDVAFIDAVADKEGMCIGGVYNNKLDLGVAIRFSKKQLPWLTNWQHWGKSEYVVGIEPGTNKVIGQAKTREQKELILIEPGASRVYDVELEVIHNDKTKKIELFKTY